MSVPVELWLTPAELSGRSREELNDATCVVFDVLRATSTIVTALHRGASQVITAGTIEEALALRASDPNLLLAGERGGKQIRADLTGSVDFDLGNSPRDFTPDIVTGRRLVLTTTNGTLALRACGQAKSVLAASFLNLTPTARALEALCKSGRLVLVCSGTGRGLSLEDTLGAGALLAQLAGKDFDTSADACRLALEFHAHNAGGLEGVFRATTNGRRLARDPDLEADIAFCAQQDVFACAVSVANDVARLCDAIAPVQPWSEAGP